MWTMRARKPWSDSRSRGLLAFLRTVARRPAGGMLCIG